MKSAASWSNAGRLRVAEPTLARLPLLQPPDQSQVLAQAAKLLAFIQAPGTKKPYIGLRAASDAAYTTIHTDNRTGGFLVDEGRIVALPAVVDVLRFFDDTADRGAAPVIPRLVGRWKARDPEDRLPR